MHSPRRNRRSTPVQGRKPAKQHQPGNMLGFPSSIISIVDHGPKELSFGVKSFTAKIPAHTQARGDGITSESTLVIDPRAAICIVELRSLWVAPTRHVDGSQPTAVIDAVINF